MVPTLDDPQDVVGVEYQVVIAVEDDLCPRVLGEDYDVPSLTLTSSPSPMATTSAVCGFSLAVSGRTMPEGGSPTLHELDQRPVA